MAMTHYAGTPYPGLYHQNKKLSGYKMMKAIKSKNFVTSLLCSEALNRKSLRGLVSP